MALKKHKELPSGVVGEYWKIISVSADKVKSELTCRIALFKDKAASDSGKKILDLVHSFSGKKTKVELSGDLTSLAYEMVKQQCSGSAPSVLSGKLMAFNDLYGSEDI